MPENQQPTAHASTGAESGPAQKEPAHFRFRNAGYGAAFLLLGAFFYHSLSDLIRLSLRNELYNHVLIIPLMALCFVWLRRSELEPLPTKSHAIGIVLLLAAALGFADLIFPRIASHTEEDHLVMTTAGFLVFFGGLAWFYLGQKNFHRLRFPFGFLFLTVPFPTVVEQGITTTLQHGSAAAARGMFALVGTPVYYHDLIFQLPGLELQVAPECSGIHSSWSLFIVSLIAGFFFLRSPWRRSVLTLAVFPLALLRNGFRVATIGELCIRIGPEMINSPIHRHGGPLFFALSLVPFALLLWYLVRSERRAGFKY